MQRDRESNLEMKCDEALRDLPLYLLAGLDATALARFERHLADCACCRQSADYARLADEQLRRSILEEPVETGGIVERFQRQIAPKPSYKWHWAAAAIVLISVAGAIGSRMIYRGDLSQAALRDHHREVIEKQPRRWISDMPRLEQMAAKQKVNADALAKLAPIGYELKGGRVCFLNGKVYVHVVYANPAGEVSLFLRSLGTDNRGALASAAAAGDYVAGVEAGGLSVLYVTGAGAEADSLAKHAAAVL